MNDTFIISIVTFIYFFAAFVYLLSLVFKKTFLNRIALVITVSGLVVQTMAIILRWNNSYRIGIGHAPLSNFYESLVVFSWSIILIYIIMLKRNRHGSIGMMATFFAFILLAYASLSGKVAEHIQPLVPALQSNWLISHVISSFIAYACFTISFITSVLFLVKARPGLHGSQIVPEQDVLDEVTYKMISVGFILLTLGIITGAAWADCAWGRYWGWDPKETWSLITWLIYGAFLHTRLVRGWKGFRMSLVSVIGFISVLFTYLGVNYVLRGLHSYLS